MFQQIVDGKVGDLNMVDGRVLERAGSGEAITAEFIFDLRPLDAGCIYQQDTVSQIDALLTLGNRRFIAGLGDGLACHRIDQC